MAHFMSTIFGKNLSQIKYTHKLQVEKSYKNTFALTAAQKVWVKLTPPINFIKVLHAHFSYKSELSSFSLVTFWQWQKDFGKKALSYEKRVRKMLMKLTPSHAFQYYRHKII